MCMCKPVLRIEDVPFFAEFVQSRATRLLLQRLIFLVVLSYTSTKHHRKRADRKDVGRCEEREFMCARRGYLPADPFKRKQLNFGIMTQQRNLGQTKSLKLFRFQNEIFEKSSHPRGCITSASSSLPRPGIDPLFAVFCHVLLVSPPKARAAAV